MTDDLVVNICLHGVGKPSRPLEQGEHLYWLEVEQFYRILDDIHGLSFVRLSVDDGNVSDLETVLPALLEREMTAAFFVLAGRLGIKGSLAPDDVAALRYHGMQVGSHGFSHTPWPGLPDVRLHEELVIARELIAAAAGTTVDTAACPLGRHDDKTLARLRRLGYTRVFTSARKAVSAAAWCQPRFSLRKSDNAQSVRRTAMLALALARAGADIAPG